MRDKLVGDNFDYIRNYYGVPASLGGRVRYNHREPILGTITGTSGPHILIKLDGERFSKPYHPTDGIEYLPREETQ